MQTVKDYSSRPAPVPEDLGAGFKRHEFLALIYNAVQSVRWPNDPQEMEAGKDGIPPAMLRTLLTYSYVTGMYSSREIEYAARSESIVRYICARHPPGWPVIRQFRRRNMPWLKQAVAKVCELAAAERGQNNSNSRARWSGPSARDFTEEAEHRLRKAIQADSMALDE